MNWLEKLSQKAMALPFPNSDLKGGDGISLIDAVMDPQTATKEKEKHPNISYWSAGNAGVVADIGEKVIKYSLDRREVSKATLVKMRRESGNPIPCVPQVYEVEQIQGGLHKIVFEKVEPLNRPESGIQHSNMSDEQLKYYHKDPEFRKQVKSLMLCLEINQMPSTDMHTSNLGRNSQGQLVLLDLG